MDIVPFKSRTVHGQSIESSSCTWNSDIGWYSFPRSYRRVVDDGRYFSEIITFPSKRFGVAL